MGESTQDERPTMAENVLTASYDFSEEPVDISEKEGLAEAIEEVAETKEEVFIQQSDSVVDYKVYWNKKTDSVRFGAVVLGASYEVPDGFLE